MDTFWPIIGDRRMEDDEITAGAKRDYRKAPGALYANPFAPGTAGFNAYERGWMQALKQDHTPSVTTSPRTVEPARPVDPDRSSVNLYALAKGHTSPRK